MIAVNGAGDARAVWAVRIDTMLRDGALDIASVQRDSMVPGRTHERLDQRYQGLPVFGGQVVRQMSGRDVVSISGRLFDNVSVPTVTASIDETAARAAAERHMGSGAVAGDATLGIVAQADRYVLAYRLIVRGPRDVRRYDINAVTGAVEAFRSELRQQGAIGRADRGARRYEESGGAAGQWRFRTIDGLRPAEAATFAFNGWIARLVSFLTTGLLFVSDFGFSTVNEWNDGALVDAHAFIGWTYDYYFKVFNRQGLDDRNFEVAAIVHPLARSLSPVLHPDDRALFIDNALYLHPGLIMLGDGDGTTFSTRRRPLTWWRMS